VVHGTIIPMFAGADDPWESGGTPAPIGTLYVNSTTGLLWTKTSGGDTGWESYSRFNGTAAGVAFTPAGSIAATDVQAAIEEVMAEAGGGTAAVDPADIADPTLATPEDVALKLNALMGAMRTAGSLA
jgi:hypothetical protein